MLPELRAYIAKARLRRGIEVVKLGNRIKALKMSEDDPEDTDFPDDPTADGSATPAETGKSKLSRAMKGAIFREVVMAKVQEKKEQEEANKVKEEVEKEVEREVEREV